MTFYTGLDIGGTKIAGAVFASDGNEVAQHIVGTPDRYDAFLDACRTVVKKLDAETKQISGVGIGIAGSIDYANETVFAPNITYLKDKPLIRDLQNAIGRSIRIANDADCAALSEALDGGGAGHKSVFGLILGTGVGGGFVMDGKIVNGPNGLTGEIGHLPLPFRETSDGPLVSCGCGQKGCIEKSIAGPALSNLYEFMTGKKLETKEIAEHALKKEAGALRVLNQYYEIVAKAMVTIIHTFDPEIIVVSGGLSSLPGLYEEVPERWGQYAIRKQLKTKFVPARYGAMSGLRGAAWLGK